MDCNKAQIRIHTRMISGGEVFVCHLASNRASWKHTVLSLCPHVSLIYACFVLCLHVPHKKFPNKNVKKKKRPNNCITRYLSKGHRYAVLKGHMHPNVYSSTISNSQSMGRA